MYSICCISIIFYNVKTGHLQAHQKICFKIRAFLCIDQYNMVATTTIWSKAGLWSVVIAALFNRSKIPYIFCSHRTYVMNDQNHHL